MKSWNTLTRRELRDFKERMELMVSRPNNHLQFVLAKYWLDRINRKGKYVMRED